MQPEVKKIYDAMPKEQQQDFLNSPQFNITDPGTIKQMNADDMKHWQYMNETTTGKTLGAVAGVGRGLTKGSLQVLKGVSHLINHGLNNGPMGQLADMSTDAVFDKADENTNMGLTKGDLKQQAANPIQNMANQIAYITPSILGGEATGSTKAIFALQGIGQGKEMLDEAEKNGVKIDPKVKTFFPLATGIVNGVLMGDLGESLFSKFPNQVRDGIVNNITIDAIKENAGKDVTQDMLKSSAATWTDRLKRGGVNYLKSFLHTGADLSALSTANYALEKGADKANTTPIFNNNDLVGDIGHSLQQAAVLAVPGGVSGILPYSKAKDDITQSIAEKPTDENVQTIKDNIAKHAAGNGWKQSEMTETLNHVQKIADAAKSLPESVKPSKKIDAVNLILGRNELQNQLDETVKTKQTHDPALQDIISPGEQMLTDKIEQANDKLRDIVQGTKTTYSKGVAEEDGKFFKTIDWKLGDAEKDREEISPSRYQLENIERESKKNALDENNEATPVVHEEKTPIEPGAENPDITTPDEGTTNNQIITNNEEHGKENDATEKESSQEEINPVAGENGKENGLAEQKEVKGTGGDEPPVTKPRFQIRNGKVVSSETGKAIDYIKHGLIVPEGFKENDPSARLDLDMPSAEKRKAVNDITNGNFETAPAKKLINKVQEFEQNGEYPVIEGLGGSSMRRGAISADEMAQHFDDAKSNKIGELSPRQIEEFNQHAKELGITAEDVKNYEEYRNADNGSTSDGRPTESPAEPVQQSKNDQTAGKPQSSGSEAVQGKPKEVKSKKPFSIKKPKEETPSLNEAEAQRLLELRKKFSGQFNDITRIPTLLADKEFREYAGLVFKDTLGDFKAFSKRMLETVGEKIKEHLPNLYKDLGGTDKFEDAKEPIGISKSETKKQREERGLEDLPESEKTTLKHMFEDGKQAIKSGEINPRELASEVMDKPRNLSATEVNALLADRRVLHDEADKLRDILEKTTTEENPQTVKDISDKLQHVERQLDNNEQALRKGARENAIALVSMQNMINSDYSHSSQMARMRAKAGGELTEAMKQEVERYSKELEQAKKELADYKKSESERLAKIAVENENAQAKKKYLSEKKQKKDSDIHAIRQERKAIVNDFLGKLAEIRKSQKLSSDVPYRRELAAAAPFMRKMIANLAKEGIVEFKDIISNIHDEFSKHIDGLTDRDIMDALSGVYKQPKESKNELIEQRNAVVRLARLTTQLEDLKDGLDKEKSERKIVQKRDEIVKLEKQVKELEKQVRIEHLEERTQASLKKRIDAINQRIKNNDFEPPVERPKINSPSAKTIHLEAQVRKAENNFDAMAERLDKHKRTKLEKGLDLYRKINLAFILSGTKVLGKLYGFGLAKRATNVMDELANTLNSKTPFIKNIINRSPRYSGGIDLRAESKAISARWNKATRSDVWETMKTGAGDLDRTYGKSGVDKDFENNHEILDFFQHLHGAVKTATKRAEFFRSFEHRLNFYAKQGEDIHDPDVQFKAGLEAYADGKRAILMNDNLLTDKFYKGGLRMLENSKENSPKALAAFIRSVFPITKVPTNFVLNSYDRVTGAIPGISRATPLMWKAIADGAESLTNKEADAVSRILSKGQVGLGMMALAYFAPKGFIKLGGYYTGKRKDSDLKAGDVIIGGVHIPHNFAHNDVIEAMQFATTVRRAQDSERHTHKSGGALLGVGQSIKGLTEQIPFVDSKYLSDFTSGKAAMNTTGEFIKNKLEPRLLQEAAEATDKKTDKKFLQHPIDYLFSETRKRDPKNIGEHLETGLPILREHVKRKH